MPDTLTRGKLFTVEVDGCGSMIAYSPQSSIELARVPVLSETTEAHVTAARGLMIKVFENLEAQGYPRAYDDEDAWMPEPDRDLYERVSTERE